MDKFLNYVDIEMASSLLEKSILFQLNNPGTGYKNVFLHGKPALGKSQIVREIAQKHEFNFIDLRLAGVDETAVLGLPYVWEGIQYFSTPSWWPKDSSKPTVLMIDELKSAHPQTQVAAFKLILDRQIQNGKTLPDNVVIVAAGNMQSDRTGARELTVAMATRFCMHLVIDPATANRTFLNYAVNRGLSRHIVGYLEWRKQNTYIEKSDEAPTATPRTWEALSNNMLMYSPDEYSSPEFTVMVAACVGTTVATDFIAYTANIDKLPDWERIRSCDKSYQYDVPANESGIHFAVATGLALEIIEHMDEYPDAMYGYARILESLPPEMRIVFFRNVRRDMVKGLRTIKHPEFSEMWKNISNRV